MSDKTFATVINCMDGRTQLPVNKWTSEKFDVEYVDTITEAGPDRILADENDALVDSIKKRVSISVQKHGSKNIVMVSHHDCAGHPVSKEQHMVDLEKSVEMIKNWGFDARIFGVWVDENWVVHKILEK